MEDFLSAAGTTEGCPGNASLSGSSGAGKMAEWLEVTAAPPDDPQSVQHPHWVVHNCLELQAGPKPSPSSWKG